MEINRVIGYYNKSYYKAAKGQETGRETINTFKKITKASQNPAFYNWLKKIFLNIFSGYFYWPTSWPTSFDPESGALVYGLVRLLKPETAIEIGTFKGYTSICIGQALEDNKKGKLYTMDPFEMEIVKIAINKSGLKKRINYINDYSHNVIPKLGLQRVDFVLIDGDHSYESVKRDFELVKNLIPSGGTIIFHDTVWFEGPKRVVEEVKQSGQYEVITFPTLVGTDEKNEVTLNNEVKNFKPVGISVCYKL